MRRGGNLDYLRILTGIFIGLVCFSIIAYLHNDMGSASRLVLSGTVFLGLLCLIVHFSRILRRYERLRYATLAILALFMIWMIFGGRSIDTDVLRDAYVRQLNTYKGTKFVWGGETKRGIDCSGLTRTAFYQAMLKQGVRTLNPRLIGLDLWLFWWHDMSAKDMANGLYGYTQTIGDAKMLAGCDTSNLLPGDLAVVEGAHVLIYCGDNKWIEASPEDCKVVINKATIESGRSWFNAGPVRFVRWSVLANKPPANR